MILKELTINGFKSFAKKGELEFSAPITAIVGPNGSGKSNVAESFRFVLGEQSVKSMRGKKGEDLIWGGSTSLSRGNRASVEVVLDNTGRVFALDFDEVKIERAVHRDGQNEYFINGSAVRLKDVQELLAAAHVGASGHHIISQGEADRILSASAKERREMIEDALGLRVYQYKKQESEKKLEKTRVNIEQVESLRREHAPHLKYLKKQVERMEKSLALQAELKTVYAEYLKREDIYIAHHTDRLNALRRAPAERLEEVIDELTRAKERVRQSTNMTDRSGLLTAEETLSTVRRERQGALRNLSQLEGQISYIQRRIEEANKKPVKDIEFLPVTAVKELLGQIEKDVEGVVTKEDVGLLQRSLSDIVTKLRLFLRKVEPTAIVDTSHEEAEAKELYKQFEELKQNYANLEQAEKVAEENYQLAKSDIEAEANQNHEAERIVFELVGQQRTLEMEVERIDRELSVLWRDRDEFKRELQEAVALIKSAASHYYNFEIIDNGVAVTTEQIVSEERGVQNERRRQLEKLKIRLEELGTGVTEDVIKEYEQAVARDEFLAKEIADLETSATNLEKLIADLTDQLQERFIAGIDTISVEFNRFFILMFGGGKATLDRIKPKLRRVNEDDTSLTEAIEKPEEEEVGEEGVVIDVALPNKKVRGLDMLSGGERALTSIALIFAMSQVNPPPFIILDETDAALDEANSRRYGDMIEALAKKSQLILITHNRETMSRAGILYGVTMGGDGVSKLLSVKFDEAAVVAKS